jgi:hypothetical protein
LARQAIGLQSSSALLSAGLTFVGTNVLGAAGLLVSGKWEFLGDIRYTPPLGKFVGFETIPFALALIVGLSLVCVMILEKRKNSHCTLAAILLVALGFVYPILFPVGCMLVLCAIFLLATPTGEDPQPTKRVRLQLAVAFGVALFMFAAYLSAMTSDRSVSTFQLHTLDNFKTATRYAVVALLPILALAAPLIRKAFLVGKKTILLLTVAGLGSMALYLLFSLSNLEYKFLLAAALLLTPIAVGGIEILFPRSLQARWQWYVSAALPIALVLFFLFLIFKTGVQIPDNLANTPKMIEDSFWLQLDQKESDSGWTGAVRHRTPENTIVVLHESRVHIASFANRALFFPGFGDGDAMAGYSVPKEYYLIEQRGYPKVKFDNRSSTVRTIYTESDEDRLADALRTLLELQRPIAVHFSNRYTPVLLWLKKNKVGEELYSDSKNIVWFINRQVAASIPNRSATHAAGVVSAISSARKDADFLRRERR